MHNLKEIIGILPNDGLREKRIKNIKKAKKIIIEEENNKVVGVVFINHLWGILPNITWIVSDKFRKKGIATKLVKKAQLHYHVLTAKTRNIASNKLAKKTGFREIFKDHWLWLRKE